MGCSGNCDLELHAFSDPYRPKCEDNDCRCNHEGNRCADPCGNPIMVTSDNVHWNACELRYISAKPGMNLSDILQDADKRIGDLYCKFSKIVEYVKGLEEQIELLKR